MYSECGGARVNQIQRFFEIIQDLLVVAAGIRDVEDNLGRQ